MNPIEIPRPACRSVVEGEHSLLDERKHELNGEKWIATGLIVHQLRQRRGALRRAAKRVCNQLSKMLPGKRRKRNLHDPAAAGPDGVELALQRMTGRDFVAPIG